MYDAVKILGGQSVNRMHGIIEVRMGNFLTKFHIFLSPNYVPLDYTNHSHVQKKLTAVRESLFGMKECAQDNYKSLLAKRTNERIQKIPNSIFGPTKPTSITIITLFIFILPNPSSRHDQILCLSPASQSSSFPPTKFQFFQF